MQEVIELTVPDRQDDRASAALLIRREVARAIRLPWVGCLRGNVPPGIAAPMPMDDPRLRLLRDHPRWRYMLQPSRMSRFWLREFNFLLLVTAVTLRSSQMNAVALPVTLAELAAESGLSVPTTHAVLEAAASTGDIIKRRADADQRLLALDLSPGLAMELEERHRQYFAMVAQFLGRPDPAPTLRPECWREMCRLLLRMSLSADPKARRATNFETRRTFLYMMHDLFVDGPSPAHAFAAASAARLHVTPSTVRNTLARARADGWLEAGALLVPTAMARSRFGYAFAVLEARWQALFDVAEALARHPSLAGSIQEAIGNCAQR
jgi:DNA-binding Lrp family transcriptional regulator